MLQPFTYSTETINILDNQSMNSDTPTRPFGVEDLETVSLHSAAPTYSELLTRLVYCTH